MTPPTHDIDWDEVEDDLFVEDMPVLAVIGDPPREIPDEAPEYDWPIHDDGLLGEEHEYNGVELIVYQPDNWQINEDGSVELGYVPNGEFFVTIPSDAYERIHAVNPMSDELKDSVLMERSDLRFTANKNA